MFIPFGDRREALGYQAFPDTVSSQPSAFAVAPDGSFWIDDRWKKRMAHYSASGQFLGAATGLDPRGWDVAIVGGQVFVLVEQATGTLGTVSGGEVDTVDVSFEGSPLFMFHLIPTVRGLVAQAGLVPGAHPGEFQSFVALNPASAAAKEVLPGLPLGKGDAYFDAAVSSTPAHPEGEQDFDLIFTSPEIAQTQPLQFELIAHDGASGRRVPAIVGLLEPLASGDDVLMYVQVAPTRPDEADRYGGGRWLLRVGRSPLLWERLPGPDMTDELHHRHLAIGPDGAIYLMVTKEDGMLILRRPSSAPEG